jgi:sugar/nucleoside kinase (ribokinase family)
MKQQLDFLAVGDIVTDAFIELEDAWIETDNPEHQEELCMKFGDKLPYRDVVVVPAVGNSPNAGVAAKRLGLATGLLTDLGDDSYGKEQLAQLTTEGVSTDFVRVHSGMKSNYHFVLRFKAERTILVKHQKYPYIFPEIDPAPRYIYLSSLAEHSLDYHNLIADYVEAHPEVVLAFQPGTFQMKMGIEKLARIYARTNIFFCNKEEAERILKKEVATDIPELLKGLHTLGPKMVIITDGPNGAYVSDGAKIISGPMYPDPKAPVDRTGAGDAFSSTFVAALALGKTPEEALLWGPINSMSVVQEIGAQKGLLSREKLEGYLSKASPEYKIKGI